MNFKILLSCLAFISLLAHESTDKPVPNNSKNDPEVSRKQPCTCTGRWWNFGTVIHSKQCKLNYVKQVFTDIACKAKIASEAPCDCKKGFWGWGKQEHTSQCINNKHALRAIADWAARDNSAHLMQRTSEAYKAEMQAFFGMIQSGAFDTRILALSKKEVEHYFGNALAEKTNSVTLSLRQIFGLKKIMFDTIDKKSSEALIQGEFCKAIKFADKKIKEEKEAKNK